MVESNSAGKYSEYYLIIYYKFTIVPYSLLPSNTVTVNGFTTHLFLMFFKICVEQLTLYGRYIV